jgi:succinate dehydrogenase hydrophobic anchor subunit
MRFTGIISAFILLFFFVFTLKYFLSIKEPNDAVNRLTNNLNAHLKTIEDNLDIIIDEI